jgi:GAF domain-containing protein
MSESHHQTRSDDFSILRALARLSATTTDLYSLLNASLSTCLEHLPLSGAVVWLRANEDDMITPSVSRMPASSSTSAIADDDPLLQRTLDATYLVLNQSEAQHLIVLPATQGLALAPIRNGDALLGLLGFVAEPDTLEALGPLLEASANMLSGPTVSAWLRRQQAEAADVQTNLFRFASELREQSSSEAILRTLNKLALRTFNCDWSASYVWQQDAFYPVQIATRIGEQSGEDEPALDPQQHPLLEVMLSNPDVLSIRDLDSQPNVMRLYIERYALRGLVLIPLQKTPEQPQGLLALGYRAPISAFSSHHTALAQGLAHMVGVALDRTRPRE